MFSASTKVFISKYRALPWGPKWPQHTPIFSWESLNHKYFLNLPLPQSCGNATWTTFFLYGPTLKMKWTTLSQRRELLTLKAIHKCVHKTAPNFLNDKFMKNCDLGNTRSRGASKLYLQRPRTDHYKKSFEYAGARLWNTLPEVVRNLESQSVFSKVCALHMRSS